MSRVCVGVHVHAEPQRLLSTLDSLRVNTAPGYSLLILYDGPDDATRHLLASLSDVPLSGTDEPRGTAACFNRLATSSSAGVVVLLESGSTVGDSWLNYLLAALDSGERNGLAGPSTNCSWNEQCVYPDAGGTADEIARTARAAAMPPGRPEHATPRAVVSRRR